MSEAADGSCTSTGAGGVDPSACCGSHSSPHEPPTPPPPSPSPPDHSPLPIAPTPSPNRHTMTLPELKRRLEAHIRDSGVVDTILASLRASLLLPPTGDGRPPLPQASEAAAAAAAAVAAAEEAAGKWRRRAEELEARAEAAAAEARDRVRRECEERLRGEMEQGACVRV